MTRQPLHLAALLLGLAAAAPALAQAPGIPVTTTAPLRQNVPVSARLPMLADKLGATAD